MARQPSTYGRRAAKQKPQPEPEVNPSNDHLTARGAPEPEPPLTSSNRSKREPERDPPEPERSNVGSNVRGIRRDPPRYRAYMRELMRRKRAADRPSNRAEVRRRIEAGMVVRLEPVRDTRGAIVAARIIDVKTVRAIMTVPIAAFTIVPE